MRRPVLLAIFASVAVTAPAQAATLSVSPNGSDSGSCTSAFPCKTFARAYAVAASGDVVSVAAGTYPSQSVPSGNKFVTFKGSSGTLTRQVVNDASNVTYDGINVDAGGVQTSGAAFELGGDHVTVKNASVGNVADEKAMLATGAGHTVDNVVFHDAIYRTDGVHMECLYAIGVPGFTLRNSFFRDCAVMDVLFTYGSWWSPKPPSYGDVTIENNVFAHSERENNGGWHYYSLYIGWIGPNGASDPMNNWVVRNNTFESAAAVTPDRGGNGTRWVGNVGSWDCKSGVTYRFNVGRACSGQDKAVSPASSSSSQTAAMGWNNPGAYDFHLKSSSPAINAADPNDAPARDRDGHARSGAPDAGAYEYGGTAPSPTPTPTATPSPTATPTPTATPSPTPTATPTPAPSQDRQAPSVPQGMAWTTITQTSIGLRWNASSDNVGVTGYRIYRNGSLVTTTGASARSYTVSGLQCGTSYTIALTARDAAGNESNPAEATGTTSTSPCSTADREPPSVPQGMAWTTITRTSIGLKWDASTDNVGVTGYRIYRDGTLVTTTGASARSYTVSNLKCGTRYTIALTARDAAGNESYAPAATGATTTKACAATAPSSAPATPDSGAVGLGILGL